MNEKMGVFLQKKLWRDKMIQRAEDQGSHINWRRLDDTEYDHELRTKLIEEAEEVRAAKDRKELIAELADIFEVVDSFKELHGISQQEIIQVQEKKRTDRGGFSERKFVDTAEHPEGSFLADYCLAEPQKYPEIKDIDPSLN